MYLPEVLLTTVITSAMCVMALEWARRPRVDQLRVELSLLQGLVASHGAEINSLWSWGTIDDNDHDNPQ